MQAEMRCHDFTCYFDVVWGNCWPGSDVIAYEYKLEGKEIVAQGHMEGSVESVVSLLIR